MKKIITLAIAASFMLPAIAQVSSRNAAGYVKVTIARGTLEFVANPFNTFDGTTPTITDLLGVDNLPIGTIVSLWDADGHLNAFDPSQDTTQKYVSTTLQATGFFTPPAWSLPTLPIARAEGFFIRVDLAGAANPTYDVYLYGEVPDSVSDGVNPDGSTSKALRLESGLTAVGLAYPVAKRIDDSNLSVVAEIGDICSAWNGNGYDSMTFQATGFFTPPRWGGLATTGLNPQANPFVLEPGKAYFYRNTRATSVDWEETKPYNWP